MRSIEHDGQTFEYDESCIFNYGWQKQVVSEDASKNFKAAERLFMGKDEEVAERLGGSMEAMGELIKAIMQDNGRAAKN